MSFPATFDLSNLNGFNGFTLNGVDATDQSGLSVSSAGDVNGDGVDDLIIGANRADPGGDSDAGESYVVFGTLSGWPAGFDLSTLDGSNGFVLSGIDGGDYSGQSVSGAGDVNGDGVGDLIIGAYVADVGADTNAGETYVVFGKTTGWAASIDLSALDGSNGFILEGIDADDWSGYSVSSAGDINNDGYDDVIIGARLADPGGVFNAGESYVVFGKATGWLSALDLSTLNGANGFVLEGFSPSASSGHSVSDAGDVNGDGYDDLIIGSVFANPGGQENAGESYVVFGKASGWTSAFDLSTLDGSNGVVIEGVVSGDYSGNSVSSAGDVNGDGYDDVIIGAYGAESGATTGNAGKSYVVFGKASGWASNLDLATLDGSNGFALEGIDFLDESGRSVSSAGDFNGDGYDDVIIGAKADVTGSADAGESYVVFGKASGWTASLDLATLDGTNGILLPGIDAFDISGWSVSEAGDVNGDGIDDVIIGAYGGDPAGITDAGESYVIFGGNSSGFAARTSLASLNGKTGFVIEGINSFDRSGGVVSSAGDINGDGFDDVIIGALDADPGGQFSAGESYVVFGKAAGWAPDFDLSSLDGSNGFVLNGVDELDYSGTSVSAAGDINGDGFDDVMIGAVGADPGGDSSAGESYVVFGKASGWSASFDLSILDGNNGFVLEGIDPSDMSGRVSFAGDMNGDGFDDVIIGAHGGDPGGNSAAGESYVVFGKASGWASSLDLSALDGSNGFLLEGIDADDWSGLSVSSAGDLNGDGFDDVIIGARLADPGGVSQAGESYVVFGKASGWTSSLDLSNLNGVNGFVLNGILENDLSGRSVSSAGDINGDGFGDIVIGASAADPGGTSAAGESYVVFGKASGWTPDFYLSTLDGSNGFVLQGIGLSDFSGFSVSGAGDVNGDGFDDVIIGAYGVNLDGNGDAGESYVVFGKPSGWAASLDLSTLNGTNGFVLEGIDASDRSGRSVSAAGDVNGDGIDDVVIGAYQADPGGTSNAGESYVVFGRRPSVAVVREGNVKDQSIFGGNYDDELYGLGGDDLLDGGAGDDRLDGGNQSDTASYAGAGSGVTVTLMVQGTAQDTQGAGNDILVSIENLRGSAHDDTLTGDSGDNRLEGGDGADVINGGAGNDTASYEGSSTGVNIQLQYGIITGGDATGDTLTSIENLIGSNHNDTLIGNPGINVIHGRGGNDTIKGLANADELYGEDGDDWIFIDNPDTHADGGSGTDRLIVVNGNGATNAVGVNGFEIATGNSGVEVFDGTGATANLTLRGLSGDDILTGGDFDDYIYGDAGADRLIGGDGLDRLFIDENDTLINGGAGTQDRVIVQQLASATVGVTVNMKASNVEVAFGNLNDDTFDGSGSPVALSLYGRNGQDTLLGGSGNDRLFGDNNDTASGDILNGGEGNDFLRGGSNGASGWAERDQFIFDADWGNDRIFDFADNGLEKIDFSSLPNIVDLSDLKIIDVTDSSGSYALISYTDGGGWSASIRVYDVAAADLGNADFVFV